jgi:hypothetical protein
VRYEKNKEQGKIMQELKMPPKAPQKVAQKENKPGLPPKPLMSDKLHSRK